MNDIEILEEFIDKVDIYFDDDIGDCAITSKIAGMIENLIQRNKELEDTNKKLYELCQGKAMQEFINNECGYIPKSKIKEKIEEIKKYEDYKPLDNRFTYKELINYGIEILQELLEESEK